MKVQIFRSHRPIKQLADITIVIDVIRAFTVAHYAFLRGAERIFLAKTVDQAFQIKHDYPKYLLAGEVNGFAIEGFDLDNSPYNIIQKDLRGNTLVQKTTNGVRATLNSLECDHLFVTGFTNARTTAEYIKDKLLSGKHATIHIIASHPSGDDDFACAEYMKQILKGETESISVQEVMNRIKSSHVAQKFFDSDKPEFKSEDVIYILKELDRGFVMRVNQTDVIPMIERVDTC
ncbi:2-phosphosulfolactate phosphatase [Tenuibacillus multivorans]|uniref:Probable 2-phosphosulfolactate phosphatase n=1 Tax=Tenuibacillus multivorans TaxID=237069 RepID=A0A1H0CKY3_9BACI|nr:2-phosphosulfolactate phosphatase [Tenuibacillus multivorans]GEL76254.1 putative 2-phosphosulfolactate phosphatase [Tenuibacillus multivorans]SDN58560.1 2-phosphosulfolactate phosphatase [Tenuibacillus multivorans]